MVAVNICSDVHSVRALERLIPTSIWAVTSAGHMEKELGMGSKMPTTEQILGHLRTAEGRWAQGMRPGEICCVIDESEPTRN